MIRAIARQAEAERERRAKVIHARGELEASLKLTEAAEQLAKQPISVTLRYLQTLTEIGVESNTTVVVPLPINLIQGLSELGNNAAVSSNKVTDSEGTNEG